MSQRFPLGSSRLALGVSVVFILFFILRHKKLVNWVIKRSTFFQEPKLGTLCTGIYKARNSVFRPENSQKHNNLGLVEYTNLNVAVFSRLKESGNTEIYFLIVLFAVYYNNWVFYPYVHVYEESSVGLCLWLFICLSIVWDMKMIFDKWKI